MDRKKEDENLVDWDQASQTLDAEVDQCQLLPSDVSAIQHDVTTGTGTFPMLCTLRPVHVLSPLPP